MECWRQGEVVVPQLSIFRGISSQDKKASELLYVLSEYLCLRRGFEEQERVA
jgi:hypothetical protein